MSLRSSLEGRIVAVFALAAMLMAAIATWVASLDLPPMARFLLSLLVGLPVGLWILRRVLKPLHRWIRALSDAVASLRDRDFSVRLAESRSDEIGELVTAYNEAVEGLSEERNQLRERELLLESALQHSPLAVVLSNHLERVIFANFEARRLFVGGLRLEGRSLTELLAGCPESLGELLASQQDGLFTVDSPEGLETYHLTRRSFRINRLRHTLLLLRRLTLELNREEVRIWKKVVRVLSHELNNSLAPISSLAHSAGVALERPDKRHRLQQIVEGIEDRVLHLRDFLESYARFARLPLPRPEPTDWHDFLERLRELYAFDLSCPEGAQAFFDPGQMEQVIINLVKNAHEACAEEGMQGSIEVRVSSTAEGGSRIEVLDRGPGMAPDVMRQALLPFFSTKGEQGTGVGLPLAREIVANHGGSLRIAARQAGGSAVILDLPGPSEANS